MVITSALQRDSHIVQVPPATMSVFLIIVFLSLKVGKSGGAIKPVVTFTPIWGNIIFYDDVTLTCNVPSTALEEPPTYHWYKDNQTISGDQQSLLIISSSKERDSGHYQCRINDGDLSDPVFLNVTKNYVILQRPPSAIYEGDPLTLRCHHIKDFIAINTKFYKDDKEIKSSDTDPELHIHRIHRSQSGLYKCTKRIYRNDENRSTVQEHSDVFSISVKELFSPPEITTPMSNISEGGNMTVRCHTRLDPLRGGTHLYFAFYRDGRTVQEFSVSDTYRVQVVSSKHSGNYTCEVRTMNDAVRKRSDGFYIQITQDPKNNKTDNKIGVITGAAIGSLVVIIIIIISAVLVWKCKTRKRFSHEEPTQVIPAAVNDTDPDPQDVCYTYLDISHLSKGPNMKHDELTVTYATVTNPNI